MHFWQSLILALIAAGAAVAGVWRATSDLKLRRQITTTETFLSIVRTAHGLSEGRAGQVGPTEQAAAMAMVAEFGAAHRHLREASKMTLAEMATWDGTPEEQAHDHHARIAREQLGRLNAMVAQRHAVLRRALQLD